MMATIPSRPVASGGRTSPGGRDRPRGRRSSLRAAAVIGLGLLSSFGCRAARARLEAAHVGNDLRDIAAQRGASFTPRRCASVEGSRVTICEAELSAAEVAQLRSVLSMGPLGETPAPGPAFGQSRCLDGAPAGTTALVTGFPWMGKSHYRYLLLVVPSSGGLACVETEEGYG